MKLVGSFVYYLQFHIVARDGNLVSVGKDRQEAMMLLPSPLPKELNSGKPPDEGQAD